MIFTWTHELQGSLGVGFNRGMEFNATFNNISVISWWSVLLVEETRVVMGTDWIGSCKSNYHTITTITAPYKLDEDCHYQRWNSYIPVELRSTNACVIYQIISFTFNSYVGYFLWLVVGFWTDIL
jgi:hypothetical protein